MGEEPIQLRASKWIRGVHANWARQFGCGSSNSGPTGKRAKRFYPGRATRKALGKHGLQRQKAKKK